MVVDENTNQIKFYKKSVIAKTIIGLIFGIGGAIFIYFQFAFNPDANNIVVAYFCIVSLVGWLDLGFPIDKLVSVKDIVSQ